MKNENWSTLSNSRNSETHYFRKWGYCVKSHLEQIDTLGEIVAGLNKRYPNLIKHFSLVTFNSEQEKDVPMN